MHRERDFDYLARLRERHSEDDGVEPGGGYWPRYPPPA